MEIEQVSPTVVVRRFRGRAAQGSNMGPGWAGRNRKVGNARPGGSLKKRGRNAEARRKAGAEAERRVNVTRRERLVEFAALTAIKRVGATREALTGTGREARKAKRRARREAARILQFLSLGES